MAAEDKMQNKSKTEEGNKELKLKSPEQNTETQVTADGQNEGVETTAKKKNKGGKYVPSGIAYISATFNNTKVTFTDLQGNVVCWGTAGKSGFKGSKKSTAYVAQLVANETAKKAQSFGMKECEVRINGPGAGRESAVRGIAAAGLDITALQDITPVPHNGCRPAKRRRV